MKKHCFAFWLAGVFCFAAVGALAVDLNAHGLPNGREKAFYDGLSSGELRNYRLAGRHPAPFRDDAGHRWVSGFLPESTQAQPHRV